MRVGELRCRQSEKNPFFLRSAFNLSTTISRKRFTHRHFSMKLVLITTWSSTTNQRLHSLKFTLVNKKPFTRSVVAVRYGIRRTPFSNFVRLCTCSLVPRPNTTFIGLGTRLVHERNRELTTRLAGAVSSRSNL